MIFDTDVVIWAEKGSKKASKLINEAEDRKISIITYMELFQSAKSKKQQKLTKSFLAQIEFKVIPITQAIGHRAAVYIEELSISNGITVTDAMIAATAIEGNLPLVSGNKKHFSIIQNLNLKHFKP